MARQYPRANLIRHSSDKVPGDVLSRNLVLLGGPGMDEGEGNSLTRTMMSAMNSSVRYISDPDGVILNESPPFLCELNSDDSVKRDFGCIQVGPTHSTLRQESLSVMECTHMELWGPFLLLSDSPLATRNHLLLQELEVFNSASGTNEFEAIFQIDVIADGRISPPKLVRDNVRRLT